MRSQRKPSEGIDVRHSRSCGSRSGGPCDCRPSFQAHVWDARSKRRIRRTFATIGEAKAWRREAQVAVARGELKAPSKIKLREAADAWLTSAREGTIRNRSGDPWKPSTLRGYEAALRRHVLPELGGMKLSEVRRNDLQDLADRMLATGADASTVRNMLMPLRAIYRRAVNRGDVAINPTAGLELPAIRGRRDRIAAPDEGALLIDALPSEDRALWATAMYAGLRRGELRGLLWGDVDLAGGTIRVERSWDAQAGEVKPKSYNGARLVPVAAVLRDYLTTHKANASNPEGNVFPTAGGRPFDPATVTRRADKAWKAAELDRITLHECRHTFASLMIAAGVNAKALSTYMGHASVTITFDRYGHLFPGSEDEAAGLLDAYLERANTAARLAALDG